MQRLVEIQGVETILVTDKQPDGSRMEAGSMVTNVGNTDEWEIARAMDERSMNGSMVRVWKPGPSIEVIPSLDCRCDQRWFRWFRGTSPGWDCEGPRLWRDLHSGEHQQMK